MRDDKSHLARLRAVASAQNSLVKQLRNAAAHGEPTPEGFIGIESVHIVEEAIRSGLKFRAVFFSESGRARAERLLPQMGAQVETLVLPDAVFAGAVATETPQGVAALVKPKQFTLEDVLTAPQPLLVITVGLQDPGNLGTIVRSAEAFGATAVIAAEGTVSPFNPKTIRASAGSLFRIALLRAKTTELITPLRAGGLRLLATSSHKGNTADQAALTGPLALFIGSEGAGLPRDLLKQMDDTVVVPHSEHVESLNAGVAASILLYEAARQRRSNL